MKTGKIKPSECVVNETKLSQSYVDKLDGKTPTLYEINDILDNTNYDNLTLKEKKHLYMVSFSEMVVVVIIIVNQERNIRGH